MIFDSLVKLVENGHEAIRDLKPVLRRAALFHFPGAAHEFLPKHRSAEDRLHRMEHFQLPFQYTAVEDDASCVLLQDASASVIGLDKFRVFVSYTPGKVKGGAFMDSDGSKAFDFDYVSIGTVMGEERAADIKITGSTHVVFIVRDNQIVERLPMEQLDFGQKLHDAELRNAYTAIEELMQFNSPDTGFIMETTPRSMRDPNKAKKIPRSCDRPIYTVLKPQAARQLMRLEDVPTAVERGSPISHWRRAHIKVLRSERYTKAQGRVVHIKATWVGPSEAMVDGKRYRVLLDR